MNAVVQNGVSIALACRTFQISETCYRSTVGNTASPTLAITNSDGTVRTAREIRTRENEPLQEGDLTSGARYHLVFVGTRFEVMGEFNANLRRDVEQLIEGVNILNQAEPIATQENDGFMSAQ